MAGVTVQDVRRVAMLARLGLTDERARQLTKDLNTILEHMEVLRRVDTASVHESPATGEAALPLRADAGPPIGLDNPPPSFAPDTRHGFILVPRISSHESLGGGAVEESPG